MALDFIDSEITVLDPANLEIAGKENSKTIRLGLFPSRQSALWRADRYLEQEGYPFALFRMTLNRNAFRLEVGDYFALNYTPYNISGIVCRILNIEEEDAESEDIHIYAMEISRFTSSVGLDITVSPGVDPGSTPTPSVNNLDVLEDLKVVEMPFELRQGVGMKIIALCDKVTGSETGYTIYQSLAGTYYSRLGNVNAYSPAGTLVADYTSDTYEIDDTVGFQIDFGDYSDMTALETISRAAMFSRANLALLGDEFIAFQTITQVSGTRYQIENIIRGLYDTEKVDHSAGEHLYFLDENLFGQFASSYLLVGVTRYFKAVAFNSKYTGVLADATAESLALEGRAKKPYRPINPKANSYGIRPTYTGDIVLDWAPRLRDSGAGIGDADTVTDAAPIWEGYFEVEVWVLGANVRTASAINDDTWTYTSAMNTTDNGALADEITFKLRNYITVGGITYYSAYTEIMVIKE